MDKNSLKLINEWIGISIIDIGNRQFKSIILADDDMKDAGIRPRICRIEKLSDKAKNEQGFNVGDYVLVKHGGWTRAVDFSENVTGDDKMWFTIREKMVCRLEDIDEDNLPIIGTEL